LLRWLQSRRHARHADRLEKAGLTVDRVYKVKEGRPIPLALRACA
jgi:hypothetical protein